jgi:dinuclear metal center YbgI/SA1388 family protein
VPPIRTVLDEVARIAPWSKAAGWDPVGLQVGDPEATVERIGVCHDVTRQVLDAAAERSVDLLVAYHPLLFEPTRRFVAGPDPAGLALRAAASGIGIAVVHTAFDVAAGGAADARADALGLGDVTGFGPLWGGATVKVITFAPADSVEAITAAMAAAGAGRIGGYAGCSFRHPGIGSFTAGPSTRPTVGRPGDRTDTPEERLEMVAPASRVDAVVAALVASHPYEEPAYDVVERRGDAGFVGRLGRWEGDLSRFATEVAEKFGGVIRSAGAATSPIRTVAVVPGSGASLARAAGAAGADALVTGDVKHHDARSALAAGLAVVDPGHAATERPGVARLYAAVAAGGVDTVDLTAVDADPWAT